MLSASSKYVKRFSTLVFKAFLIRRPKRQEIIYHAPQHITTSIFYHFVFLFYRNTSYTQGTVCFAINMNNHPLHLDLNLFKFILKNSFYSIVMSIYIERASENKACYLCSLLAFSFILIRYCYINIANTSDSSSII